MPTMNTDNALASEFGIAFKQHDNASTQMNKITQATQAEKQERLDVASARLVAAIRAICTEK